MAWWWNLIFLAASFVIVFTASILAAMVAKKRDYADNDDDLIALITNDIALLLGCGLGFAASIVVSELINWPVLKWQMFIITAGTALVLILPALVSLLIRFFSVRNLKNILFWLRALSCLTTSACLVWMSLYILLHCILGKI